MAVPGLDRDLATRLRAVAANVRAFPPSERKILLTLAAAALDRRLPPRPVVPPDRAARMAGMSAETRDRITRLIELSPVLEDAILEIADCAFADGQDN
jgi:hypothetical protein